MGREQKRGKRGVGKEKEGGTRALARFRIARPAHTFLTI